MQKRTDIEEHAERARRRSEEMEKQYANAKDQPSTSQKPAGILQFLSGCAGICFSSQEKHESRMAVQLKQVQEELSVSRATVQKLQTQREQLEAQAKVHEATAGQETTIQAHQGVDVLETSSRKSASYSRTQTPAVQREMKKQIQQLGQELQISQKKVNQEEQMRQQVEHDTMHHEAHALTLELKMRTDKALAQKFDELVQSNTGQSKSITADLAKAFRGKTPAKQREMKEMIQSFYSELEAEERQAAAERAAHDAALKKLADLGAWTPTKDRALSGEANHFASQTEILKGA